MIKRFLSKGLLFVILVFFLINNTTHGEEVNQLDNRDAKVRIEKYMGDRLDIPTPEERDELNLLVSIEEREPI